MSPKKETSASVKEGDLDEELEESFPASDPPAHTQPKKPAKEKILKDTEGFSSREELEEYEADEEDEEDES